MNIEVQENLCRYFG